MVTFQDLDWSWLKETSQHLTNSGFSSLRHLFEPQYVENLLGPIATDIIRGLVGNEYISTGAFLLICGSLLGPSHAALSNLQSRIWKEISVSVTIEERDEVYQAVEEFLTDLSKKREFTNLIATARVGSHIQPSTNARHEPAKSNVQYAPGYGQHSIHFKGKKIRIRKELQGTQVQYDGPSTNISNTSYRNGNKMISLWTLSRDSSCLQDLVREAINSFQKKYDGKVQIFQYIISYNRWSSSYFKEARNLDSVVLPVGLKEELIKDMKLFLNSSSLYRSQCIPYRRTYLLEGPPGTGKSSLIQALASELRMNICIINLSDPTLTESTLNSMMNTIPLNSMILIEDLDALATRSKNMHSGLSWCGLLNSLDGVVSQEGTTIFMTTNSVELLDAALLRPGRVDKRIPFHLADDFQIRQLFTNFFGHRLLDTRNVDVDKAAYGSLASLLGMKRKVSTLDSDSSRKTANFTKSDLEFYSRCFANYIRPYTVSPAELQAFFLNCRDDDVAVAAHKGNEFLEMIKSLRPQQQPSSSQSHCGENSAVILSQATPLRLNVPDTSITPILHGTPTKIMYEREAIEPTTDSASTIESYHEVQGDDSIVSDDDETKAVNENSSVMSGRPHGKRRNSDAKQEDESDRKDGSDAETEGETEGETEDETEGEDQDEGQGDAEDEIEDKAGDEDEGEASSASVVMAEQQPFEDGDVSESDADTIAQLNESESAAEKKSEPEDDNTGNDDHMSKEDHENSEDVDSNSDDSELDLTPAGKQVENMPAFPSPKKQERVVADVLKHKMSRGLTFMEATDAIFKEGILGVDAAVIYRVLGEKSVTPIKKIVHRTPSFQARRASRSLQRRLKKERSQKKLVSDENEWRDDKLNAKDKGNTESPIKDAIAEQKQTVKARTKTHHSKNDSPLRKFAAAQKQTSLRKAANLPRRTSFKSSKKSPNPVTSKSSQDQESSEYDSGTERARQELDDFLQRKSGSGNKHVKAEKI